MSAMTPEEVAVRQMRALEDLAEAAKQMLAFQQQSTAKRIPQGGTVAKLEEDDLPDPPVEIAPGVFPMSDDD